MSGIRVRFWLPAATAATMAAVIGAALTAGPAAAYSCKPSMVRSASAVMQSTALSNARSAWSTAASNRYGPTWQYWSLAQSRSQHCTASGGMWKCNASGQPCR
jgi:hypothetical protein